MFVVCCDNILLGGNSELSITAPRGNNLSSKYILLLVKKITRLVGTNSLLWSH